MGWFNRLRIRQLKKAQAIVKQRIDLANNAIAKCGEHGELAYPWVLHHARMLRRFTEMSVKIADLAQRERNR